MEGSRLENEVEIVISENRSYDSIKRFLDILSCTILFLITIPILFIACILVFMGDWKNPIYVQQRVGLDNKEFYMYKVRSMVANAERYGAQWANVNDERVTWIGKFIRKTRIDELPQLINVIKGDMSLIGPRPEREVFYKEFEKRIPEFRQRLKVRPGITGYAQVNGGYDITPQQKLEKDLYYIENKSMKVDFKIAIKTIGVVITGEGAR